MMNGQNQFKKNDKKVEKQQKQKSIPKQKQKGKQSNNSNPKNKQVLISKALSKLLRHQAIEEGLDIDNQGFINLEQLISHHFLKSLHTTPEEIFKIVDNNDKKRFKIVLKKNNDEKPIEINKYFDYNPIEISNYFICALQGHSLKNITDSYKLTELKTLNDFPNQIIHGTNLQSWKLIKESNGLSKMKRNHIHFASGLPDWLIQKQQLNNDNEIQDFDNDTQFEQEKVISGMRKSAKVLIYLNINKIIQNDDHLIFYKSGNGVILTPGDKNGLVSKKYFLKVTDIMGNLIQ